MKRLFSLFTPSDTHDYIKAQNLYRRLYARAVIIIGIPLCVFFSIFNLYTARYVTCAITSLMFLTLCILLYDILRKPKDSESNLFQNILSRLLFTFFTLYLLYAVGVEHSLGKTPWFLIIPALVFYSTSIREALIWISCITALLVYFLMHSDLTASPEEIEDLKIRLIVIFGILSTIAVITNLIMRSAIITLFDNQKKLHDTNRLLDKKIKDYILAERALRDSEVRTRTTFDAVTDAVFLHPLLDEGFAPFADVNATACERYGYARDELLSMTALDITKKSDATIQAARNYRRKLRDSGRLVFNTMHITKSGKEFPVEINSAVIELGNRPMALAVVRDITDRQLAAQALQESENRYRAVSELTSDYAYAFRVLPDGELVNEWVTGAILRVTGYSLEELQSLGGWEHLIHPDDIPLARDQLNALLSNKKKAIEYRIYTKSGQIRWMRDNARPVWSNAEKRVTYIEGAIQDITDRKLSQQALHLSHKRFLTVLDSIDATIYVADMASHEILFMNKNMIDGFGRDMTGELCWNVFRGQSRPCPDCTNPRLIDESGRPTGVHVSQKKNPILDRWFINYDRAIEWTDGRMVRLQIATDITDFKMMEEKLRQAQKMEAIGTLAGGIAHDFNNLLMGIQGSASLMAVDLPSSHPHVEHLDAITGYIKSAVDLTKQLLGIFRGGKYEVKPLDLNQLISQSAAMFGRTRKELLISTNLLPTRLVIEADRSQIEQVLLNLYVNAWQAMPGGGKLFLETAIVSMDTVACEPHQIEPGRYGKISVTDTGTGMDDATCQRIFDPFFTTKEKGRGTGLGLASAYGIVKNHGGMISVTSEIGHGTTFTIWLPLSEKTVQPETILGTELVSGTGTILLVDDEDMVIRVGKAMLEKLGYQVLVSRSGSEAVDAVNEKGADIDIVILDLIMPGMDGGITFDRIRVLQPEMPVLISSGYALSGQASEILSRGGNGFIQKPFSMAELSQKLQKILVEARGSREP